MDSFVTVIPHLSPCRLKSGMAIWRGPRDKTQAEVPRHIWDTCCCQPLVPSNTGVCARVEVTLGPCGRAAAPPQAAWGTQPAL